MYSIHFFKAYNRYCLYYVTKTEYRIEKIFSGKFSAKIYGIFHNLTVNDN